MPTHHFTLIVEGAELHDESILNGLFESGCDDALVGSTDGVQFIDFDRDAASLDAAVLSAMADAERVDGIRVLRVAGAGLAAANRRLRTLSRSRRVGKCEQLPAPDSSGA